MMGGGGSRPEKILQNFVWGNFFCMGPHLVGLYFRQVVLYFRQVGFFFFISMRRGR